MIKVHRISSGQDAHKRYLIKVMDNSAQPTQAPIEKKSEYSFLSIVIAFMLLMAVVILSQFFISDLTKTFAGEKPVFTYIPANNGPYNQNDYEMANKEYNKSLIPYETQQLTINSIVSIPLFVLAIILMFSGLMKKSSFKLVIGSFFAASAINIFILLSQLATYIYSIDPKIAVYGISLVLIVIFIFCIWYIQEKYHKNKAADTGQEA